MRAETLFATEIWYHVISHHLILELSRNCPKRLESIANLGRRAISTATLAATRNHSSGVVTCQASLLSR